MLLVGRSECEDLGHQGVASFITFELGHLRSRIHRERDQPEPK